MKKDAGRIVGIVFTVLGTVLAVCGGILLALSGLTTSASVGIIGGADGPTAVFVAGSAGPLAAILMLCGTGIFPLVLGIVGLATGIWMLCHKK